MKTAELIEQRAAIVARMNEAHTADNGEAFTTAETELRSLDAKLDRARKLDAADRTDPGRTIHGGADQLDRELRSFSITRMIAHKAGLDVDAGREIEMQAELTKRAGKPAEGFYAPTEVFETRDAQVTGTSAAIVPTSFRPDLFTSALTNSTVMQAMGSTVLTSLTGNVVIPRETGSPAVGWVAENVALPYGNFTADSLTLSPHHVGAIVELSRQLLMQSSPAADALVRQMLSRNIALEIDRAAIAGTGANAQPTGILNAAGVPSVAYDTDLFTTTANMIAAADIANVGSSRSFVSTNGVKAAAAKLRDATGHPIASAEVFHGESVQFSNQVPNNLNPAGNKHGLVYGDWSDFLIGIWSQLDILVNPYAQAAYEKGNILIRAMATVDFGVRRPASFVKATGVVTG
jgi:HK97 family phage major capsid protein